LRIAERHAPDQEERRLHAFRGQCVEHPAGIRGERTVIEAQDHFVVIERQRLIILQGSEPRVLGGIEHDGPANPERARMARTFGRLRPPESEEERQQKD
jgi:hypothetical protein